MSDQGYRALVSQAIESPSDRTELRDAHGRLARIERDSAYPGAVCVRLDAAEHETPYPIHWVLPPTRERPEFYPAEVPFVPDLECRAMLSSSRAHVIWIADGRPSPDQGLLQQLQDSMPASLKGALEAIRWRREGGRPVKERSLQSAADELGNEAAIEWVVLANRGSEPKQRFVAGFDEILRHCIEAGWQREDAPEKLSPAARAVSLRRGDSCRALVLRSVLGVDSLSMTQEPASALE